MYNKNVNISDAEMRVMRIIWDAGKPMTSPEIIERLEGKDWKQNTILTLIKRLHEKHVLTLSDPDKQRNKAYVPALSESEYKKIQTHNFINKMFMGSAKGMVATLFDDKDVYGEDLDEIREWLNKRS